ncbi:MAG: ATP-binding protein [Egibacteraceae bacterium]
MFVNRGTELEALDRWWERRGATMGLVWGRKRVGKTALLGAFASGRRHVFHIARGAPPAEEVATLAGKIAEALGDLDRDLRFQPFNGWPDVLATLARAARDEPLVLVLDEFPELVVTDPTLPMVLRAVWDEVRAGTMLRLLLCGSAVRTMAALQEERSALHGRFDLRLQVHPFRPHEAALLLRGLEPPDRARVYGLLGGVPLYLSWWDADLSVEANLAALACTPGGQLRNEGECVLATEGAARGLTKQVLYAIATGLSRHAQIVDAVRSDRQVAHVLANLEQLRIVERVVPVTDDPRIRTGRTAYRLADNFLAFWMGLLAPHLADIDRGLGSGVAKVLMRQLDDFMGPRYEEAFRDHLRRLASNGEFGDEVTRIGPYWTRDREPVEIDAVALAGRSAEAVVVGEAKWAEEVDGRRLRDGLARKAAKLPNVADGLRFAVAARTRVRNPQGLLAITAADIFN